MAGSAAVITGVGTQYYATLTLGDPTYVEFDPSTFTAPGVYTIFQFTNLVGNVTYLTYDAVKLFQETGFNSVTFAQSGNMITAELKY